MDFRHRGHRSLFFDIAPAVMLAPVASIHVFTAFDRRREDVDGRDKPDHDGKGDVQ
jgi:hypothetical protein